MNLPKTGFPMRAGLSKSEPKRLKDWQDNKVYEQVLKKNEGHKKFVLHDGPPYANGPIHIGHAMNKISKDMINRYWMMQGYEVPYVPGWDCHGQPIEHKVEEKLGTEKFNQTSTAKIRELCNEFAVENIELQKAGFRRLGVLGDWDNPYLTLYHQHDAADIEVFKAMFDKGMIYRGHKPFMGFRAVRYCLANPDQYKVQLRALLRASAFGDVKIMIPLVTCVEEVLAVKELVEQCKAELTEEGRKFNENIEVGIMVETPAASLLADRLAEVADFFSIGTNDLIGYTMCADRGNDTISNLYQVYYPAVLRSLKNIIESGVKAGIMVGMCGEAAADPLLEPLLISWGLEEFSMSAPSILRARKTISQWTKAECDELAEKALACNTAAEVKALLESAAR